ncbi:MAG: transcriptional repressor LexA [Planctomycetota bacterium]
MACPASVDGLVPLSPRQSAVLEILQRAFAAQECPPTRQELGSKLGVRAQTADFHLRALERKGYVELGRNSRSIRLLVTEGPYRDVEASIPILGRVAAGVPILAVENQEGRLPQLEGSRADFALRVQGDSMIEAGILDGDLVLVEQAAEVARGEIVVALLGAGEEMEATVKRYLPFRNRIVLHPENSALPDRVVRRDEPFALAGRVVGVLRCWG